MTSILSNDGINFSNIPQQHISNIITHIAQGIKKTLLTATHTGGEIINLFKQQKHIENQTKKIDQHITYQQYTKQELINNLTNAKQEKNQYTTAHKESLNQIKQINKELSVLKYKKIGILSSLRNNSNISDSTKITLEQELNKICVKQDQLRSLRDEYNVDRKTIRHKHIPQSKENISLATVALKEDVSYINHSKATEQFKGISHLSQKNISTIVDLLQKYDNLFAYVDYDTSYHGGYNTILRIMIDSSKNMNIGSIVKLLGENHHEFHELANFDISQLTSLFSETNCHLIDSFYQQVESPKNQFLMKRYQSTIQKNYGQVIKQITAKTLPKTKRHLLYSGKLSLPVSPSTFVDLPKYTHK